MIVGAGAAGCVLAARLSDDPAVRVALLEAGGHGRDPLLAVPKAFYLTMDRPRHAVRYPTRDAATGGPGEWWLRGRGLGGSTLINGMMYLRGWEPDYAPLALAGDPGWAWPGMLAVFRDLEDHDLGPSVLRGVGGPLHVSVPRSDDRVVAALRAVAADDGLRPVDDVNASDDERIGWPPSTIRDGVRVSAASAFLRPVWGRANLTVLTGLRAVQVPLAGTRAVGVRCLARGGRAVEVRARREVIVSAGALESPRVGEGLLEHRGVTVTARLRPGLGRNEVFATAPRRLLAGAGYLLTRSGPVATGPYELVGQLRSAPQAARPDVQVLFAPMSPAPDAGRLRPADHAGLMLQGYQLRPTTPGSVHVVSADPGVPPRIDARFLETRLDREVTGRILTRLRGMLTAEPLADLVIAEESPGPDVATPDQVVELARSSGGGIYHAVGSCAMGPDPADVLDAAELIREGG